MLDNSSRASLPAGVPPESEPEPDTAVLSGLVEDAAAVAAFAASSVRVEALEGGEASVVDASADGLGDCPEAALAAPVDPGPDEAAEPGVVPGPVPANEAALEDVEEDGVDGLAASPPGAVLEPGVPPGAELAREAASEGGDEADEVAALSPLVPAAPAAESPAGVPAVVPATLGVPVPLAVFSPAPEPAVLAPSGGGGEPNAVEAGGTLGSFVLAADGVVSAGGGAVVGVSAGAVVTGATGVSTFLSSPHAARAAATATAVTVTSGLRFILPSGSLIEEAPGPLRRRRMTTLSAASGMPHEARGGSAEKVRAAAPRRI